MYQGIVEHAGRALGCRISLAASESVNDLRRGAVDAAFVCGLPYVRLRHSGANIEPLGAPVVQGARYGNRAVYFSDVIVRRLSGFQSFEDLRGSRWVYNDPESYSGYLAPLAFLHGMGESFEFFGRLNESGSHRASISQVATGRVDAAAIDSQVLALEMRQHPDLEGMLKVIASIGPAPSPPLVAAGHVSAEIRSELARAVCSMGADASSRAILDQGMVERFEPVTDASYDAIREAAHAVEAVHPYARPA